MAGGIWATAEHSGGVASAEQRGDPGPGAGRHDHDQQHESDSRPWPAWLPARSPVPYELQGSIRVAEVGQSAAWARLPDRQPHGIVGRLSGRQDRRGDRHVGMDQHPPGGGLPSRRREAEQHPGGVLGGAGQRGVAGQLGLEAAERLGAVVELKENGRRAPSSTQTA